MKKYRLFIYGVIVLVVGGGSFFGGMKYQESKIQKERSVFSARMGGNRTQNGSLNGSQKTGNNTSGVRPSGIAQVIGEITGVDQTTVTVKTMDGGSRIIVLSGTTSINKMAEGTKTDLAVGTRVAIFGTENTDKTVNATSVQINPSMPGAPEK